LVHGLSYLKTCCTRNQWQVKKRYSERLAAAKPNVQWFNAVVYRQISSLKFDPRNPRVHSDRQVRQISDSIKAFGFNVPALVDASLKVIAGHGRILACQRLGWTEVPTILIEHLSEAQARPSGSPTIA